MSKKFIGPFIVVDMPLNRDNEGPEMNPDEVVVTVYEIWDATCTTVAYWLEKSDAIEVCEMLNRGIAT